MTHDFAVANLIAEKYLLGELSDAEINAFEAHCYECDECFAQVKAGVTFTDRIKEGA